MDKAQEMKLPQLDEETASAIMNSVFEACGKEPSNVPLKVLSSYAEYRSDRFSLQKGILIFILIVFLLLPLCFVAPRFTVTEIGRSNVGIPTYEIDVQNRLPVYLVQARLDGHPITVFQSEDTVFTVEPGQDGELSVTVTLLNRQYEVWSTTVTGVDTTAPKLLSSAHEKDRLVLHLQDEGVGVDYESCYALGSDGSRIAPLHWSAEDNTIAFPLVQNLNIFIPDYNGNTLQLVLTVH